MQAVTGRASLGVAEIIGIAIALCGLALILVAFAEWGWARDTLTIGGEDVVRRASFPGVGDVKVTFNSSVLAGEVNNFDAFHNTNPGWVAILFGALVLIAGVGYWRLNYRSELAVAAAACGIVAAAFLVKDLLDLRGTLGDQPGFAEVDVTRGIGLYGACLLAVVAAGLGLAGFAIERHSRSINSH